MDFAKEKPTQRTSFERHLIIICYIGALSSIVSFGVLFTLASHSNTDVCLTQECVEESAAVLDKLKKDADPYDIIELKLFTFVPNYCLSSKCRCDDFYEFACGNFLTKNSIPDDEIETSPSQTIQNKLDHQLQEILNEPHGSNEIKPFQDVKKLYRACLNTAVIEDRGVTPVTAVINSMGGWPVIGTWNEYSWSWHNSMTVSSANGFSNSYFINLKVDTSLKNSTKRIVYIDQATLGLNREYLIKNMSELFVEAYYNYKVDMAVLFGATRVAAERDMAAVLDFEIQLAKISLAKEERRDFEKLYTAMTVETLQTTYNYAGHNWLSYFNSILPPESQLSLYDMIFVGATTFFEQLGDLLARTRNRVLANYVAWRQAYSSVDYLPKEFKQRQQEYHKILYGISVAEPRWLQCVEKSLHYYEAAIGALYILKKHFKTQAKSKVLDIVNNIKYEFRETLKNVDWIDNETKSVAIEKVESMNAEIGFARELLDNQKLVTFYELFPDVNENEYYETILKLNIALDYKSKRKLRQPVDKTDWTLHIMPTIVNAFYSLENIIKIPAGILQDVFFNYDRPQYMNYGGIGWVVGHEINHGFDDVGRQYDAVDNLRNWWTNTTREIYLTKAQCIINQYGKLTEPLTNLKLNGLLSLGENIADNGGIKHAYRAYVRWARKNHELKLPGLDNYTPQQMFWISVAHTTCMSYRNTTLKHVVTTDEHSPAQFRVNVPLSNLKEFSDDFHCPVGTPMNPVSKCEVW